MTITTKFNINDEVWFIHPRTQLAVQGKVCGIECRVNGMAKYETSPNTKLRRPNGDYEKALDTNKYSIDHKSTKDKLPKYENELFPTKQELINSL